MASVVSSCLPPADELLTAALLLLVVAAVSATSAEVTSFEVEACSEVCLESVVFSGADLREALVGILAAAAAAATGLFLPVAGLLSGCAGADLLEVDLVGVFLSSFVVLAAEVCLAGEVCCAGTWHHKTTDTVC